jgi:hypothetical protein
MLSSIDASHSAAMYIKKPLDKNAALFNAAPAPQDPPICYGPPQPKATAGDSVKATPIKPADHKPLSPALFHLMRYYYETGNKLADVNQDGNINVADFTAFLNSYASGTNPFGDKVDLGDMDKAGPQLFHLMRYFFETGNKLADVNHDGNLNVLDFTSFLNQYAAGTNPFAPPPAADVKTAAADLSEKTVDIPVTKKAQSEIPASAKDTENHPEKLDPSLFTKMIKLYGAGDKQADIDGNGNLNINDFMAFLNLYAQGMNPFEHSRADIPRQLLDTIG